MRNEAYSSKQLAITVAGIAVSITCDDGVIWGMQRSYKNFLYDGKPEFSVELFIDNVGDSSKYYNIQSCFIDDGLAVESVTCRGLINLRTSSAELAITSKNAESDIDYFLRVLYALLVHQSGGLMLHAAGFIHDDKAFVFMGHSGKGKSTLIKLSEMEKILSDDLIIVRPGMNEWVAYATPFWNPGHKTLYPYEAKLSRLYSLQHEPITQVMSIRRARAIAEIISNVPVIPDDPLRGESLISICDKLLDFVPTYYLCFSPDKSFLEVLQIEDVPEHV